MSKPIAMGPQSRTVIGAAPSEADKATVKPNPFTRYGIPLGLIALAVYIGVQYKP